MAAPYKFPWGLHPLDPVVENELKRRVKDYNLNPTAKPTDSNPYAGPRSAWIRVFSNGISSAEANIVKGNGFVLGGTQGFDESYGFGKDGKITIGVDCYGNKHEIPAAPTDPSLGIGSDTPNRPPPSLVSLETEFSGGNNSGFNATCRKTKITWKCYSLSQLEYLAPYFLSPRITVLAEWGWNNYNPVSLVDLSSTQDLYDIFQGLESAIDTRIKSSNGNYDLALGFITDYGYTMNDFGGFDCYTTITNPNYLTSGKSYQNRQDSAKDPNDPSGSLKLKDFTEFVFDDMDNLVIQNTKAKTVTVPDGTGVGSYSGATNFAGMKAVNPVKTVRDNSSDIVGIKTKDRVFKDDKDQWMRMDLVVEIINKFFSIGFLDVNGKESGVQAGILSIENVPICAHPAIKSVTPNFIVPNQYAPRFIARDSGESDLESKGRRKLRSMQKVGSLPPSSNPAPQGEYFTLFPNILKIITDNKLDDSYDNLLEALSSGGAKTKHGSFPQFKNYNQGGGKGDYPKAGYWGYLEDIFVSVKYFKELVQKNETVLRLIEELLQGVSSAMCNIAQLQLKTKIECGTFQFVIDNNFTPIGDAESAATLPRITLNAVNHAFMKHSSISIKISNDMMNQMVMQSASKKPLPEKYGTATYDPKTMKYSQFQRGDRLFDRGVFLPTQVDKSNKGNDSEQQKYSRMFTEQNADFYIYKYNPSKKGRSLLERTFGGVEDTPTQIFILTETSSAFMKSILLDMKNADKAVYVVNGIMPGTDFKMDILGIGGITFLSQFTLDHVPSPYSYRDVVWQISDVRQKVENKVWGTSITAQPRPLNSLKEKA